MWGHVSSKTSDGKRFPLLPLRPPADPSIPDDDVLEYDLEGKLISGQRDEPEEIFFYTCAYKAKKEVGAADSRASAGGDVRGGNRKKDHPYAP